jgi:hypothetical protein
MTFKSEYLGEFTFILENNLRYDSGDQGVLLMKEKEVENFSASVPLS